MKLYERVSLIKDETKYGLKAGDVATLIDYVQHPSNGEVGCVLEISNAIGENISVITVPVSSIESLKPDEIFSVRHFSKAV